jgi:hypothetical protein
MFIILGSYAFGSTVTLALWDRYLHVQCRDAPGAIATLIIMLLWPISFVMILYKLATD